MVWQFFFYKCIHYVYVYVYVYRLSSTQCMYRQTYRGPKLRSPPLLMMHGHIMCSLSSVPNTSSTSAPQAHWGRGHDLVAMALVWKSLLLAHLVASALIGGVHADGACLQDGEHKSSPGAEPQLTECSLYADSTLRTRPKHTKPIRLAVKGPLSCHQVGA